MKNAKSREEQEGEFGLLGRLNRLAGIEYPEDPVLRARIKSYELAYRMQTAVPEVFRFDKESEETQKLYGLDHGKSSFASEINPLEETEHFSRKCLVARRLLERGVRFVQCWQDGWDTHSNLEGTLRNLAKDSDQAISALLTDLKQRGLLENTLVIWGGEFGRTPTAQGGLGGGGKPDGRDHNSGAFSMWMAGGGVKGGYVHGASDELGFAAVKDRVHVHDLHATILRLLGFDHERFTYRYAGRDFRLTDVYGKVVKEIIA